jgi:hypothetical protein
MALALQHNAVQLPSTNEHSTTLLLHTPQPTVHTIDAATTVLPTQAAESQATMQATQSAVYQRVGALSRFTTLGGGEDMGLDQRWTLGMPPPPRGMRQLYSSGCPEGHYLSWTIEVGVSGSMNPTLSLWSRPKTHDRLYCIECSLTCT